MPGLSLVWAPESPDGVDAERWAETVPSPSGGPEYRRRVWVRDDGLLLASSAYEGYPIRGLADDGIRYVVEGTVFPSSGPLEAWCSSLGDGLFRGGERPERALRRVRDTDGDFVVAAFRPATGELAVVTDRLGRLPLYAVRTASGWMVSRDIASVLRCSGRSGLDAQGVAERLAFGYSLGTRTHYDGVRRLAPATLLRFEPGEPVPEERTYFVRDFAAAARSGGGLDRAADDLAARLRESARRRCGPGTVLSLSGGLDSRSVAAALSREDLEFSAATFLDPEGRASEDARVAAEIADTLGLEWRQERLPPHGRRHLEDLLELKAGLNPPRMAFILPFFEALRDEDGPEITYMTGDGGDKALPKLGHPRKLEGLDDLVELVVDRQCVLSTELAEGYAGVPEGTVRASLRSRLASYPEADLSARYTHFLVYERAVRHIFEGEDRNRYYFWSSAPFFARPVFERAFRCPEDQKAHYRLYREFLKRLSPAAARIERPAVGGALTDRRHELLRRLQGGIARLPWLEVLVERVRSSGPRPAPDDHPLGTVLDGLRARDVSVSSGGMDVEAVETALRERRVSRRQADALLGVAAGARMLGRRSPDLSTAHTSH